MKIFSTCHNHCTMCDGKNTAAEMINAAIAAGFTDFGMSCHSRFAPEQNSTIKSDDEYIDAMRLLQKEYAGVINFSVGIEQDMLAPVKKRSAYDYLIGSVHSFFNEHSGTYYSVDASPNELKACIDDMFGGDAMAMVRDFYTATASNARKYQPDIIGHFDLVTKFNDGDKFFDESSVEYKNAALDALAACAQTGAIFEVNTGGVYRGAKSEFYPAPFLLEALYEMDAKITLNADAHCVDAIDFGLSQALEQVQKIGFKSVFLLKNGKFNEIAV